MNKILGISGSLRAKSYNTALLHVISDALPDDWTMEIITPIGLPLYNEEIQDEGWPTPMLHLVDKIRTADVVIIATPEYNYSIPGGLKNAIDWISRVPDQPFKNKPVGIVGAAGGRLGTVRAQLHLRQCFQFLEARVMSRPEVLIGTAHQAFSNGALVDPSSRAALQDFIDALVAFNNIYALST